MKILLDHNIDRRFARLLSDFQVATTQQMGWSDLLNGDLLESAELDGFRILITADSNIRHQQNLAGRSISIVVLRSPNNRLATHVEMIDEVEAKMGSMGTGEIVEIFHPTMRRK